MIAGLTTGLRSMGWLQTQELKSFDLIMRLLPKEQADERLLIYLSRDSLKISMSLCSFVRSILGSVNLAK